MVPLTFLCIYVCIGVSKCAQQYVYGWIHVHYACGSHMSSVRYYSLEAINILIKFNFVMCMDVLSAFLSMYCVGALMTLAHLGLEL